MRLKRSFAPSLEKTIFTVVAVLACAIIALGLLAVHKDVAGLKAQERIYHDQTIVQTCMQVLADLQNAETGQRGYLITREKSYLAPYAMGVGRVYTDIGHLARDLPRDRADVSLIEQIRTTTAAKLAELRETIRLRNGRGFKAAAYIVDDNQGKKDMDILRRELKTIRLEYQHRLALELKRAKLRLGSTERLTIVFSLALLMVLAVAYYQIQSKLRWKRRLVKMINSPQRRMPVTGLPDRQLLMDWLVYHLNWARREGGKVTLLLLDVDGFEEINRRYGKHAGDEVLRETALRLRTTARSDDLVVHLGDDQFAVVMANVAEEGDMAEMGHRMIDTMSLPVVLDQVTISVGISVGISCFPEDAKNREHLLDTAKNAAVKAKIEGRHRVAFYHDHTASQMSTQTQLRNDFHRALADGEFCIFYQPILDAKSMRLSGAEALVRWKHPTLGMLPPGEFLVLAERTGFIRPLGAWILQQACMQAEAWRQNGLELRVSVNVSAQQCREATFFSELESAMTGSGLPPDLLELELTEGVLMHEEAERVISRLGGMGISVAIDDFGTGYASLGYLQRITAHRLKVDRSFVRGIPQPAAIKLLNAIVNMAHRLELEVTAEGIETMEQEKFLRGNGCDALQGFRYSRAVDVLEFEHWSRKWAAGAVA